MKTILNFIKTTATGGLLFLIPVVITIVFVGKAFALLRPILQRSVIWANVDSIIGKTLLAILTGVVLCLICFAAGLLIRLDRVKRIGKGFEEVILKFLPGFEYLKFLGDEEDSENEKSTWRAGLLQEGEAWVIAFIIESQPEGYSTVFIPESPRADSGNTRIMPTASLKYVPLQRRQAFRLLRKYGAGSAELMQKYLHDQVKAAT